MTIGLGLIGLGKIARDQHLPAIGETAGLDLCAIGSRNATLPGIPSFPDIDTLLHAAPDVQAVTLCTPPQGRFDQARAALLAGKHVMLEKPPGATLSEIAALVELAEARGLTLFATWHSREAAGVAPARDLLRRRKLRAVHVTWKEDVRHWHPGQAWIWEPGGLGVFDPGINALSIVTRILPETMFLEHADLSFPANRATPIAADLTFRTESGVPVTVIFDWRQTGPQTWDIALDTEQGPVLLSKGGSILSVDGVERMAEPDSEYRRLYARFRTLINEGASDVDVSPLRHVADAFLLGRRREVAPFED
ncbi:Gfo/Idh/MocA family protein [Haematobacter genomosp. 1]|uniref:D-galactose 1-dehydrogenase n=1 Tax=Haematobacter genomosp. 1 TaxID=366618 RepID=A0A212AE03_9RHOB|nr:Gfo/Idh/MocA family oxidoreductase [Haematobacter genomosp. 1]OWJ79475.1 D-galactose 1-dehydrogenase [Haematobacter genomosp. 1]